MQTILFLDDCPLRTKKFLKQYPHAECADTAEKIIDKIQEKTIIHGLFLDHDLGGTYDQESSEKNCGMEVVRFLVANKRSVLKIYVHSMNAPAGQRMTTELKNAGYDVSYIPFINLGLS